MGVPPWKKGGEDARWGDVDKPNFWIRRAKTDRVTAAWSAISLPDLTSLPADAGLPAIAELLKSVPVPQSSRPLRLLFRVGLELRRELAHALFHDLAGLESHRGPRWDGKTAARHVGVPPHPWLRELDLEDSEIPEFDVVSLGQRLNNLVERLLDDLEHIMLHQPRFIADV